jgi:Domain of unknown function (DUF4263)
MAETAISFSISDDTLLLHYRPRDGHEWVLDRFNRGDELVIKRTYHLNEAQLLRSPEVDDSENDDDFGFDEEPGLTFVIAHAVDDNYLLIDDDVLQVDVPVLLSRTSSPSWKWFTAEERTSVMRVIATLKPSRIVIGGPANDAIPVDVFEQLIAQFPSEIERRKYITARISSVVRQYTDARTDAVADLESYVSRRTRQKPRDIQGFLREAEIHKFEVLVKHLQKMLDAPEGEYTERAWQDEILQIIRLLYPKYIAAFPSVPVKDFEASTTRQLDFMLVDVSGYVDVLEIKKPFADCIVTPGRYRDNHVPYRELSGTIQQVEKYLYHLNRWGREGEMALTRRFSAKLPTDLAIRIASPSGLAILGRDNNLTTTQRHDFELIRRQYKHVADIITYDDLLRRLRHTLEQLRAGN